MAGTIRTLSALDALYDDNTSGDIGFQDGKDLIHSVYNAGRQTKWIGAGAMHPNQTSGCQQLEYVEVTTLQPNMPVLYFSGTAGTQEYCQFEWVFPKAWDLGTITYRYYWICRSSVTTTISCWLEATSITTDTVFDKAYGTAIEVVGTNTLTADEVMRSDESTAVTIGSTPAEGDLISFQFYRDPDDASDNTSQDIGLLGIDLYYTTNAPNDL